MAAKVKTINQAVGSNNKTNELSNDIQNLTKDLANLFSKQFGSSEAGKAEALKYQQLVEKGVISAEKLKAALELKSQKQLAKEQRNAAIKQRQQEASVALAAAKTQQEYIDAKSKLREAEKDKYAEDFKEKFSEAGDKLKSAITSAALNFGEKVDVESYASTIAKYSAQVEARLQSGAENDNKRYDLLVDKVKSTLSTSPYLKQEAMLDNLNTLIQAGVNYNIEQRAFLQSMTDKVVTTFNAFDSNLLNLIRLQQQDSTAARMGMEASLTKSLNSMFSDTSYLSNTYDSVSQALFETIASMSRDEGLKFEYVVQKWLGSLGSVGVSDNALTNIATAINYLGTGNVEALASDSAMKNLLTIAATRQGLDYSTLLSSGLTAENTNTLLRGIVDYIQEISSTENNVVRQQFGQLFGVSISDMVGALHINSTQLASLEDAMLTYKEAVKETQSQLSAVSSRMHISEMVDTFFDNIMATTAGNIANNSVTYMMWKSLSAIEDLTGGIQIPAFSVMGNMVDLDTTVVGLMKSGMAGISLLGTLIGSISNLSNGGSLELTNWGAQESISRGEGFGGVTSGYRTTQSNSIAIVSSSGSDMADQAITAASEEGNEKIAGATSEETATEKMLKAIMIAVTGSENPDDATSGVKVQLDASIAAPLNVFVTNNDIFGGLNTAM